MSAALAGLAPAWWAWIAPLTVQVAVLAALFALADRLLLRRAAVRVRAALVWAFFARLLLPPGLESPVALAQALPPVQGGDGAAPAGAALLAGIWLAGALVAAGLLIRGIARERAAWSRDAVAAGAAVQERATTLARRIGLARAPRVLVGARARGPAAVGFLAPAIVVPPALCGARLDHALLHELAHVARRDALQALAWSLARVVFWFHPAVHWAAAHAALLRELACDERAVRVLGSAAPYRATLLELARADGAHGLALAPAFVPPAAQLLLRAVALDAALGVRGARATLQAGATFALALACVVPLARPRAFEVTTPLDDLEGCLRKRYAVLGALAMEARSDPNPRSGTLP